MPMPLAVRPQLKEAMKRSKKGGEGEGDTPPPPQLCGEGCVWVLLLTAATLVVQGQLRAAWSTLDAAQ